MQKLGLRRFGAKDWYFFEILDWLSKLKIYKGGWIIIALKSRLSVKNKAILIALVSPQAKNISVSLSTLLLIRVDHKQNPLIYYYYDLRECLTKIQVHSRIWDEFRTTQIILSTLTWNKNKMWLDYWLYSSVVFVYYIL